MSKERNADDESHRAPRYSERLLDLETSAEEAPEEAQVLALQTRGRGFIPQNK